VVVVNDLSDVLHGPECAAAGAGLCTLRDALTFANGNPGHDLVHFAIPGSGVRTIAPTEHLPRLEDPAGVTIDGYTQPGASPNTLAVGNDAVLLIEIDASRIDSGFAGLITGAAGNNVIRGIVLNGYRVSAGIAFLGDGDVVEGNFVGTDPTGMLARPSRSGIELLGRGSRVGGASPAQRNVIVGSDLNVISVIGGGSHVVQGNYVGTNAAGTASLGAFFYGVAIDSDQNQIGGTAPGAGNLVSGNGSSGLYLNRSFNQVIGNLVGTDASGTAPVPNGEHGLFFDAGASNTRVEGNVVAFNGLDGIRVGQFRDYVTQGIRLSMNRIHSNGGRGINLGSFFPLANDAGDSDTGPNGSQNFPLVDSVRALGQMTRLAGTLHSAPARLYRLEFFFNGSCDPSHHGEGERYVGFAEATTDASGNATFEMTVPFGIALRERVTATATDPSGNTSEFGPCAFIPAARRPLSVGPRVTTP
jgi:hypothetical protein